MVVSLLFLIASSAFSYRTGETFSYQYDSIVENQGAQESAEKQAVTFIMRCTATFKVIQTGKSGSYMQMALSRVQTAVGSGDNMENNVVDDGTEDAFSAPIYFTITNTGAVTDVLVPSEDEEEVAQMKSSVLLALQTSLPSGSAPSTRTEQVTDNQGLHYAHFETIVDDDHMIVSSHYSDADFVAFLDENVQPGDFSLDATNQHVIVGGKVTKASSTFQSIFSRETENSNDDNLEPVMMMTVASSRLSNFAQGNDENFESFPSADDLTSSSNYRRLGHLEPAHYKNRRPRRVSEFDQLDGASTCPGDIDFCKVYDQTWTVGNNNVGLSLRLNAIAGIKKGCQPETRSYMIGAYAYINVLVVGHTITAAEGYAEYGQQYGSPLRNAIELKLFGNSFYKKTLPWIDCIDRTITLANWSKSYGLSWSIIVYIVQIKFSVSISFGFSANLHWIVCPQQLKASIQLIPRGTATLTGSASVSIAVARAGIDIRGTVADYLDPLAYVDGNTCRVGFAMYNNIEPTTAALIGWWQTRTIKWRGFKTKITWGSKHETTFWKHNWGGSRSKIIDVYYGAK